MLLLGPFLLEIGAVMLALMHVFYAYVGTFFTGHKHCYASASAYDYIAGENQPWLR